MRSAGSPSSSLPVWYARTVIVMSGNSTVNLLQISHQSLDILVWHILRAVTYLMNHALLYFRFGIYGWYCFWKACKTIYAGNQYVLNATVFKATPHKDCVVDVPTVFSSDCIETTQEYWCIARSFCVIWRKIRQQMLRKADRRALCGVAYIFLAVVVICHDRFLFSIWSQDARWIHLDWQIALCLSK